MDDFLISIGGMILTVKCCVYWLLVLSAVRGVRGGEWEASDLGAAENAA
jgi:hypothetical protein